MGFVVPGNSIVAKAEQHVSINQTSLVQLQQQTGNRIACNQFRAVIILPQRLQDPAAAVSASDSSRSECRYACCGNCFSNLPSFRQPAITE
jgi:hypothetical protein